MERTSSPIVEPKWLSCAVDYHLAAPAPAEHYKVLSCVNKSYLVERVPTHRFHGEKPIFVCLNRMLCGSDTWINERQCVMVCRYYSLARAHFHTYSPFAPRKAAYTCNPVHFEYHSKWQWKETADPYYPERLNSAHKVFSVPVMLLSPLFTFALSQKQKRKKEKYVASRFSLRFTVSHGAVVCVCVGPVSRVVYPINLFGTGKTIHMPYAKRKINLFCCDRNWKNTAETTRHPTTQPHTPKRVDGTLRSNFFENRSFGRFISNSIYSSNSLNTFSDTARAQVHPQTV